MSEDADRPPNIPDVVAERASLSLSKRSKLDHCPGIRDLKSAQLKEVSMSKIVAFAPVFVRRVLSHEATKKGAASAAAGLVVAIICEVAWPSA